MAASRTVNPLSLSESVGSNPTPTTMELTSLIVYGIRISDGELEKIIAFSRQKTIEKSHWSFFKKKITYNYVDVEDKSSAAKIARDNYENYCPTYYQDIFIVEKWEYDDGKYAFSINKTIWKNGKWIRAT